MHSPVTFTFHSVQIGVVKSLGNYRRQPRVPRKRAVSPLTPCIPQPRSIQRPRLWKLGRTYETLLPIEVNASDLYPDLQMEPKAGFLFLNKLYSSVQLISTSHLTGRTILNILPAGVGKFCRGIRTYSQFLAIHFTAGLCIPIDRDRTRKGLFASSRMPDEHGLIKFTCLSLEFSKNTDICIFSLQTNLPSANFQPFFIFDFPPPPLPKIHK